MVGESVWIFQSLSGHILQLLEFIWENQPVAGMITTGVIDVLLLHTIAVGVIHVLDLTVLVAINYSFR
jgi:hypothetical protein